MNAISRHHNKETRQLLDQTLNPGEVQRRLALLDSPHVAPLNALARRIRRAHGADPTVPWFDPLGAGIHARVLLLLQDPSEVAAKGSGFISPDNNDRTAANTTRFCADANLPSDVRLHWNVYPWWVNTSGHDPTRPRESFAEAARLAAPYLTELLALLPALQVVVLLGGEARKAWQLASQGRRLPGYVQVLTCPHPSGPSCNQIDRVSGRRNHELITDTLVRAAELLETELTRGSGAHLREEPGQ